VEERSGKICTLCVILMENNCWTQAFYVALMFYKCGRYNYLCCNLNLGLATKARAYKGVGQEEAWESHFMFPECRRCEGMSLHTPKWDSTHLVA